MTREQAKKNLPIIQAFAEGKTVQISTLKGWVDSDDPQFRAGYEYRVKPEPRIIHLEMCVGITVVRDELTGRSDKFIMLTHEVESALKEKGIL